MSNFAWLMKQCAAKPKFKNYVYYDGPCGVGLYGLYDDGSYKYYGDIRP